MSWSVAHPHKHLIRDLWPDKHLYAAILLILGAGIEAIFAVAARVVPVTFASDAATSVAGWNWPFGILLPAAAVPLAIAAYQLRKPWMGFVAAGIEIASVGAFGIVPLLAVAALVFLVLARREKEHANPATRALHALHWPDKALAAALLLAVAALVSLVWGAMMLSGWLEIRSMDLTLWGLASVLAGALAAAAAWLCYRQQGRALCVGAAVLVIATMGLVVVGPALGIGALALLAKARREGEFASA